MNDIYDILNKFNSAADKQPLTEGWKGELAGGTAGGIAGAAAGNAVAPGLGGIVGGALGSTAGSMLGRAAGDALDESQRLNEVAPLIAAGARAAMPVIGKIAQALGRGAKSAGQATADVVGKTATGVGRGVADVSKEVGKAAVQNAPAVGLGVGAYEIAKQAADSMPAAINKVYTDAGEAASAITSTVGNAMDAATVSSVATAAVKYGVPLALLLGALYGGKKLIDKLLSEDTVMEQNNMRDLLDKLDYVAEGWKGTAAGAGLGALAGGPVGAAVGALAGDKIGDEMSEDAPMTPKQKAFAKLAPPADKITFADKIAGAKKEVDEMLGDVAAEAMKKAVVGLKNEQGMEEGNDFTGARLAAIKAGKPTFSVGGKTYKVTGDTSDEKMMEKKEKTLWPGTPEYKARFGDEMRTGEKKKSSTGGEIEKTATGVKHTRSYDDDEAEDHKADDGAPKKKGRPKGSKRALGAKGPTGKSKLLSKGSIKEADLEEDYDQDEYDEEGEMAKSQSRTIADAAQELQSMLGDNENLPEWVQKKITLAQEYIDSARDYLAANRPEADGEEEIVPEAASNSARMARIAKACAREATFGSDRKDFLKAAEFFAMGDEAKGLRTIERMDTDARDEFYMGCDDAGIQLPMDEEVMPERKLTKPEMSKREKYVKSMKKSKGDFEKRYGERGEEVMYATATKMAKKKAEEGKEEEIEETTTSGSVATAPAEAPKGKKGMVFGKGVYEGYEQRFNQMLTEGMSMNASQNEDGTKTLSVTATDDDAVKLAQILKLAGMEHSHGYDDACPECGADKGMCEHTQMEEGEYANSPEEVGADINTLVNTYSDGLDGQKTTGQTTIPVVAGQTQRMMSQVQEQAEQRLWDLYKRYESR